VKHDWLKGARSLSTNQNASKENQYNRNDVIGKELHETIVEKMIQENMATKEEIELAISQDKYDHITSSYYLLADKHHVVHRPPVTSQYDRGDHPVARQPRIDVTMAASPQVSRARSCSLDELGGGKANHEKMNNFYKPPHIRSKWSHNLSNRVRKFGRGFRKKVVYHKKKCTLKPP